MNKIDLFLKENTGKLISLFKNDFEVINLIYNLKNQIDKIDDNCEESLKLTISSLIKKGQNLIFYGELSSEEDTCLESFYQSIYLFLKENLFKEYTQEIIDLATILSSIKSKIILRKQIVINQNLIKIKTDTNYDIYTDTGSAARYYYDSLNEYLKGKDHQDNYSI